MEIDDLRALNDSDLAKTLDESQRALMNLRFRLASMQLANFNEPKRARKKIARAKTVLREREIAKASGV
jgi:large subunit ribosomal protein L29